MQTEQRIFHGVMGMGIFAKSKPAPAGDSYLDLARDCDAMADEHEKAGRFEEAARHRDLAKKLRAANRGDFGDDDAVTPAEMAIANACSVSREKYIAQRRSPLAGVALFGIKSPFPKNENDPNANIVDGTTWDDLPGFTAADGERAPLALKGKHVIRFPKRAGK